MRNLRKEIFTLEEINTGRQKELDIAKGFAIVFMVWVHTTETFGDYQGIGNVIVENFLGGPFAAPVFMICMGAGMRFAKNSSPGAFAKRGIDLLLIGLLLNVFRYVMPLLLVYAATGDREYLNAFPLMFGVDILEFAGLAFLFFAAAKKFNWSDKTLAIIAIVSSLAGMALKWHSVGVLYIDQLLGYIWGDINAETYFPFLNWIIFPVFGYIFGKLLRHCDDKRALYIRIAPVSGILGLGYIIAAYVFSFGMYGENGYYYFLGTADAIAVIMLAIGIFGACYLLSGMKDNVLLRGLQNMSRNINAVYCIQWVIIGCAGLVLFDVFPEEGLTFAPMTAVAAIILLAAGFIAHWYQGKSFMRLKPVRIFMAGLMIITMAVSIIGQTKADPIDENWNEYMMSETGGIYHGSQQLDV